MRYNIGMTKKNKKQTPCIEIQNLSFSYGSEQVLDHITFTVEVGEYIGILGQNGSGKTTLLKLILGLLEPQEGTIRLFGDEVKYFKDKDWIGYVPQAIQYAGWEFPATVEEVVSSGRTAKVGLLRRFRKQDYQAVEQALERADVLPLRKRLINELSGGQRQRVFIARALAAEPKVLILDEPTVGVDIASQEQFYALLRKLNNEDNITIVFVSHDIDVITHESKTILCLNRELVCHVASKDFITKEHLEKMYGEKSRYILHGH